jgi:hypothetical protein
MSLLKPLDFTIQDLSNPKEREVKIAYPRGKCDVSAYFYRFFLHCFVSQPIWPTIGR